MIRKIDTIIIHCSATRKDVAYSINQLMSDHIKRGFKGIGYHYYISKAGTVYATRHIHEEGAHCKGYNKFSIGICYEGGLNENGNPCDTRTNLQKVELEKLLKQLCRKYPIRQIKGHRDFSIDLDEDGIIEPHEWSKACPCFDVEKEYSYLIK